VSEYDLAMGKSRNHGVGFGYLVNKKGDRGATRAVRKEKQKGVLASFKMGQREYDHEIEWDLRPLEIGTNSKLSGADGHY